MMRNFSYLIAAGPTMTEPQRNIAHCLFVFAYANRRPRDKSEILKLPVVRQQILMAKKQGYPPSGAVLPQQLH